MDLDHAPERVARLHVKAVNVLSNERVQLPFPFQLRQREVSAVGLRLVQWAVAAALPGSDASIPVSHVVLDVGALLGFGVTCPDALRTAKIRDTRLGADAGAREHHSGGRKAKPLRYLLDGLLILHKAPAYEEM